MASKKFKTSAVRWHNKDLTTVEGNFKPYGWIRSYNQRALLVRMVCPNRKALIYDGQSIKFITTDPNSHEGPGYECMEVENYHTRADSFLNDVKKLVKGFEYTDIESEHWKELGEWIKCYDFTYKGTGWSSTPIDDSKIPLDKMKYLSTFETAMQTDMENGQAKTWISVLIQTLIECTEIQGEQIIYGEPSLRDTTNTQTEVIVGDIDNPSTQLLYNAPYTASPAGSPPSSRMSTSSSLSRDAKEDTVEKHFVVPDFYVLLKNFPGMFPLIIEVEPASSECEGVEQNLKQLLTKMFFQDVVFGIVLTPKHYTLIVIVKKEGKLLFARKFSVLYYADQDGEKKLDFENLNILCSFIYSVLKWGIKTNCLLDMPK